MVNSEEVSRGEPCAAQKIPYRLPVFFIISWRPSMNLSRQNLSCNEASVNGPAGHKEVN
jgi:hypothetical protein